MATDPAACSAAGGTPPTVTSKFAALPDIDTAPDVYETPDPGFVFRSIPNADENESPPKKEETTNENINNENLVPGQARERFTKVEAQHDRESRQLATRHRRGLYHAYLGRGFDSSEYELNPRGSEFEETTEQKLRRLLFEVSELSQELEKKSQEAETAKSAPPPEQLLAQVEILREQLESMTSSNQAVGDVASSNALLSGAVAGRELLKGINAFRGRKQLAEANQSEGKSATATDNVTYELYYTPEVAHHHQLARSAELEARLAALEKAVLGTAGEISADNLPPIVANGGNIAKAVARLDQNLSVLARPNHLEQVSRKIKSFIADLERLQELKLKDVPSASGGGTAPNTLSKETEAKVNSIFDLFGKIDPLIPLAPAVLARLRALRSLHHEASVFSESAKLITADQSRVSSELGSLKEACEKLEGSMAENQEITVRNVEALESRMTNLLGRVDKLKA